VTLPVSPPQNIRHWKFDLLLGLPPAEARADEDKSMAYLSNAK